MAAARADARSFKYELMASDVAAVMDQLHLERVGLVGWSDGACTALILASQAPMRVAGVFFFACNMDPSGTKEFEFSPIIKRCFDRHVKDYAQLSATPDQFEEFSSAVGLMQRTQPNYSADDLAQIGVPVAIVHSEHDEFIKRETRRISRSEHSNCRIGESTRCEPFRATAKARAIQHRNACVSQQSSTLKQDSRNLGRDLLPQPPNNDLGFDFEVRSTGEVANPSPAAPGYHPAGPSRPTVCHPGERAFRCSLAASYGACHRQL